jgi:hypothetical protein
MAIRLVYSKGMSVAGEETFMMTERYVVRALLLTALSVLLTAEPAHAQRRCGQQRQLRQSSMQSSLQSQQSTIPQSYALQQALLQQYGSLYGLRQLYGTQQLAVQPYVVRAQGEALRRALFLAQLDDTLPVDDLQAQLNALQQFIFDGEQSGQLTRSQVQALRKQEKALTKQLRAAQKRAKTSQKSRNQPTASTAIDD